ncbi:LysM peptidoglycan-binding domain-containing protein [soil metagenome]
MIRSLCLASVLVLGTSAAMAQRAAPPSREDNISTRPASLLPSASLSMDHEIRSAESDSLNESQLARRIAHLYSVQAEMLSALSLGDEDRYETLLNAAVQDLEALAQRPGVMDLNRFREAYRSILTEFEEYYGEPAMDRGEAFAMREAVFAAAESVTQPLLEDVRLPALGNSRTVVAMDLNRAVEASITALQRLNLHIDRSRARAATYFPMIERILAEEGVPDEVKYLAIVESALNPVARSHAGAVGLWQFMRATGQAYGLQVTRELDERRDPELATRAAARHLRDLAERYGGDWHLAFAAYNCGAGCVNRRVTSFRSRFGRMPTYWDIWEDLPRETRGYVPMYIASAVIFSNPDAFGLRPVDVGPQYAFDEVPVRGGTRLAEVAYAARVDLDAIRALNPAFIADVVPGSAVRLVRVPADTYASNSVALDALGGRSAFSPRSVQYAHNWTMRPISAGQSGTRQVAAAPRQAPRQAPREARPEVSDLVETTPVRTVSETRTAAPTAPAAPRRATTHTVRRGENLSGIAQRYGVSLSQLRSWNNISGSNIRAGQRLRVSGDGAAAAPARARNVTHVVRNGENLTRIASRYGVTIRQIREWNNLRSDNVRIGQRLRIQQGARAIG